MNIVGNLKELVKRSFYSDKVSHKDGDFEFIIGNHMEWFSIYVKGVVFVRCYDGELCYNLSAVGSEKDCIKYLHQIMSIYPGTRIGSPLN